MCTLPGGVAQLVERLNGIQEVRGSTPLISTKAKTPRMRRFYLFCPYIGRFGVLIYIGV